MKNLLFILIAFFIFLSGCASPLNQIYVTHDEFEGTTKYSTICTLKTPTGYGMLEVMASQTPTTIIIGLDKVITADKDTLLSISAHFSSSRWLFIEDGESLIFLVDGEPLKLSGTGSIQNRDVSSFMGSVAVSEQSIYPVTPDIIKKIAFASEVKAKIKGKNEFITGEFSEQCFENFKKFVNEVIEQ